MKTNTNITRKDCVVAICDFARRCREDKNSSPREIYERTGYARYYASITQERVIDLLRTKPRLVDEWLMFSEDKRCTPAWFFEKRPEKMWRVGYIDRNGSTIHEVMFDDSINACALIVRMEMEEFRLENRK